MTDQQFDTFLDDATHAVANLWPGKLEMDDPEHNDLYALNDLLTQFFASRRVTE